MTAKGSLIFACAVKGLNQRENLILCRRDGPSQMRGWPGRQVEAYLALDFRQWSD